MPRVVPNPIGMDRDLTVDDVQALERALEQTADEQQRVAQERRYRTLFLVETIAIVISAALFIAPKQDAWFIAFGLLTPVHAVGVPSCFSYLIGRPIVLDLTIDGPSPAGRVLIAELESRPVLSDDEFFEGISRTVTFRGASSPACAKSSGRLNQTAIAPRPDSCWATCCMTWTLRTFTSCWPGSLEFDACNSEKGTTGRSTGSFRT